MATDQQDETIPTETRVEEFYELKDSLKTFRADLKELKEQHEDTEELLKLAEKAKTLRQRIANSEDIMAIQDKVSTVKERMDLLKEIIKTELIESGQEEIKSNGRKFKIVQILKEMKEEEDN